MSRNMDPNDLTLSQMERRKEGNVKSVGPNRV